MKWLRKLLDSQEPLFKEKGKLEKLYPLYEAADTFLFTPSDRTKSGPHIRDSIDIKRVMFFVIIAMLPALFFGIYNSMFYDFPDVLHRYFLTSLLF